MTVRPLTVSHWSAPDTDASRPTTVAGILRAAAERDPEAPALVEGVGERTDVRRRWSYGELRADAESVAAALAGRFAPGERVAVWAPALPESLVLTYGAAMARLVLVPMHPALRAREVAHVLGQSGAAGVFVVSEYRGVDLGAVIRSVRAELPGLRDVVDFSTWESFVDAGRRDLGAMGPEPAPDDVAQIIYTSGTTGVPKGACLTHRGLTNAARVAAERFDVRPGDVYVHTMPLSHVGGQVVAFQLCQQLACAVLVPSFVAGTVLELIESEQATLTCGVPTMLLAMIEHPEFARRDLSSLRAVSGGGAVVPTELVEHIEKTLGIHFTIVFGQTEACGFISQTELDDPAQDKAATLGRPLPGVEARVVERAVRSVMPVGQVGELEVRGVGVMTGYHDLPDETAAALDAEGWLRTGDLVAMDARGVLTMAGRVKEMIVSGGENIYPAEVERELAEHPGVAQVAVVGVPDRKWGEAAVAVVRPAPGSAVGGEELEAFLRRRLAAFKVPRRWVFVEEFPLTASGKVQKFVLRDRIVTAPPP